MFMASPADSLFQELEASRRKENAGGKEERRLDTKIGNY